jgi:aryl-alcohol dehydrogenase-like predicted oxidoreductase
MDYRKLGRSELRVSEICLGSMTWGEQNSEAEGFEQLDYALDQGVNFIDTAEMYAVPPRKETYGRSEEIIGNWLQARGVRDKVVLATKVSGPGPRFPYIRDGNPKLDRPNIEAAVEASLKRLKTDVIDLYQLHWPARPLKVFGRLGYEHQEDGDATSRFLGLAEAGGGPRVVSIQNPYNFLNRSFETGIAEIAIREDCGLLAYAPLGAGILTGKYLNGQAPAGARLTLFPANTRYRGPQGEAAVAAYVELARDHGLEPAQMALAFVLSRRFLTAAILGATSVDQLKTDIAAADVTLSQDVLDEIEAIHKVYTYPCP